MNLEFLSRPLVDFLKNHINMDFDVVSVGGGTLELASKEGDVPVKVSLVVAQGQSASEVCGVYGNELDYLRWFHLKSGEVTSTSHIQGYLMGLYVSEGGKLPEGYKPPTTPVSLDKDDVFGWGVSDVLEAYDTLLYGEGLVPPTEAQLQAALNRCYDKFDASVGINWDVIANHLRDVLYGR